jgi:succinate dehydrogenase hydrophobic membrane anchor protein
MSGSSSTHWLTQRISGAFLVFLSAFFSYKLFNAFLSASPITDIFLEPFTLTVFMVMIFTALNHASLGIESILEDYIGSNCKRQIIQYLLKILNIATITIFVVAIFILYKNKYKEIDTGEIKIENQVQVQSNN